MEIKRFSYATSRAISVPAAVPPGPDPSQVRHRERAAPGWRRRLARALTTLGLGAAVYAVALVAFAVKTGIVEI